MTTMNLIERARLTDEEMWAELEEWPPLRKATHLVAEAQLAKALWTLVDWLREEASRLPRGTTYTLGMSKARRLLGEQLTSEGIERPKDWPPRASSPSQFPGIFLLMNEAEVRGRFEVSIPPPSTAGTPATVTTDEWAKVPGNEDLYKLGENVTALAAPKKRGRPRKAKPTT